MEAGSCFKIDVSVVNANLHQIRWTFNGQAIGNGSANVTILNSINQYLARINSTLLQTSIVPMNSGEYTILATNIAGYDSINVYINVTGM